MFQVFNGHFNSFLSSLGACIHLRDPELALAIESCLKGLLQAYCCHNHADERVLQALMKKFYSPGTSRPQIIVSERIENNENHRQRKGNNGRKSDNQFSVFGEL